MTPKVSIIIVNWNGKKYLNDCLSAIFKQSYENFKVILVDNGSIDGSIDFVKENFPKVDIIALNENYGYSKGNNIGIKYAIEKYNPDYVLLLNNDTKIIDNNTLLKLIEFGESDRHTGIMGCKLIYPDGNPQYMGTKILPSWIRWLDPKKPFSLQPYEVDGVLGAFFLIKREVIEKIGLLDEGFSPFFCEDTDYCVRAKKAGYLIKLVPYIEVIHFLNATIKKEPETYVSFVMKTNIIRFVFLNFPIFWLIRWLFYYEPLNFLRSIFEKKKERNALSLLNLKIKQDCKSNIRNFLNPYKANIKNLPEIVFKRFNRTKKLWY